MRGIRTFQAVLASIILLAVTAPPANAVDSSGCGGSGQMAVVVGHENAAVDVPAVQAAVDAGGTVLLKGTFDFGVAGRVLLQNDVTICGEADDSGDPLTTIRRGEWTFHTPYPSLPPGKAGPKVAIEHIHFVDSRGTAIHLGYSGGASLRHNVIEKMRARLLTTAAVGNGCDGQLRTPICERAAVVIGPAILGGPPNVCNPRCTFIPDLVSGDIEISDNKIDVSGSEPTYAARGTGMFVSMYVGADVRVERNYVTGNTRTGLAILDGIADATGRGSVVIADNIIRSNVRVGFTQGAGPRAPIGIVTGFNNDRTLGGNPDLEMIPAQVNNNKIELGVTSETGPQPTPPIGIVNIWNGARITGNAITVHGHADSTKDRLTTSGGFLATTSRQVLLQNAVRGEGCNAIRIGGTLDGQERRDNVGIGNNVATFEAVIGGFEKCADVWLEPNSHDNTMVGNSGSVIDDGVNNRVTGLMPMKGGVGDAVSDAEHYSDDLGFGFD